MPGAQLGVLRISLEFVPPELPLGDPSIVPQ